MSKEGRIGEVTCKKCLHYEGCLKRFREAKKNGQYEFTDEREYFAHADECDMFITGYYGKASEVAREIFEEIETVLYSVKYPYKCANGEIDIRTLKVWSIRKEDYQTIKKKYTEESK